MVLLLLLDSRAKDLYIRKKQENPTRWLMHLKMTEKLIDWNVALKQNDDISQNYNDYLILENEEG